MKTTDISVEEAAGPTDPQQTSKGATEMSQRYFNEVNKANRGPGGWKCSCCGWGKGGKPVARRLFRRVMKQRLNDQIKGEQL